MKRATGYCINDECEDYGKGVFLLNHGDTYYCQVCKKKGLIVSEVGSTTGKSDHWKEARVEFNYDLPKRRYRGIAIVKDNSLPGTHNVYTLQSPLIRTEKRALKVAESVLASLQERSFTNGDIEENCVPRITEKVIKFDQPFDEVKRDLDILSKGWSGLKTQGARDESRY